MCIHERISCAVHRHGVRVQEEQAPGDGEVRSTSVRYSTIAADQSSSGFDRHEHRAVCYRKLTVVLGYRKQSFLMSTVEQIVAAAERLKPGEFSRLRRKLDRLEERQWQAESTGVREKLAARQVTDKQIDKRVLHRRRENRI